MYALNKIVGYLISSVGFSMVLAVITADGAPVWANLKPEQGIYLKGYRSSSHKARVDMLKGALLYYVD